MTTAAVAPVSTLSQITPIWIRSIEDSSFRDVLPFSNTQHIGALSDFSMPSFTTDLVRQNYGQSYDPTEVLATRNALKLTTKVFADTKYSWGPEADLPFTAHLAEVGTLLAMADCPAYVIQAGLLYPILAEPNLDADRTNAAITKKFSPEVKWLVEEIGHLFYDGATATETLTKLQAVSELYPGKAHELATLHCAVFTARLGAELSTKEAFAELYEFYSSHEVASTLLNQFSIENGNSASIIPQQADDRSYSLHDAIDIRNGLRAATVVFKDSLRKWGPDEKIPLISHAAEVGLILLLADQTRDVVVAGFLHDFLERYVDKDRSELAEIVDKFGKNVRSLVSSVTEPERNGLSTASESYESWIARKTAIVARLKEGSPELADLCAATKISTIAAGNKMLFEGGAFERWSNGPIQANIDIFIEIREAYARIGKNDLISEQLDLEITRLIFQSTSARTERSLIASA